MCRAIQLRQNKLSNRLCNALKTAEIHVANSPENLASRIKFIAKLIFAWFPLSVRCGAGQVLAPLLIALALLCGHPASAEAQSRLPEFLKALSPGDIFPGADRFGGVDGKPPAAPAFAGDRLLGYVFLNS